MFRVFLESVEKWWIMDTEIVLPLGNFEEKQLHEILNSYFMHHYQSLLMKILFLGSGSSLRNMFQRNLRLRYRCSCFKIVSEFLHHKVHENSLIYLAFTMCVHIWSPIIEHALSLKFHVWVQNVMFMQKRRRGKKNIYLWAFMWHAKGLKLERF